MYTCRASVSSVAILMALCVRPTPTGPEPVSGNAGSVNFGPHRQPWERGQDEKTATTDGVMHLHVRQVQQVK
jgi:hypothetical protein